VEVSIARPNAQRSPWLAPVAVAAALIAALTLVVAAGTAVRVARHEAATLDLSSFYTAGWLVREGLGEQLYDIDVQEAVQRDISGGNYDRPLPFASPAFVAYAFAPVSAVSMGAAYVLVSAANLALLACCLALMHAALRPLPGRTRGVFLAATALSIPTVAVLTGGQIDMLIVASLLGGFVLVQRDQPVAAGLALSIACAKPQLALGVVLLLVVMRQWRVLAPFSLTGVVLAALPVLGLGFEALRGNIQALGGVGMVDMMANWRGFLVSVGLPDSFAFWGPGWMLVTVASIVLAVRCWLRGDAPVEQKWAVALLLPLVASPHLHGQSLVLVWPAAALVLSAAWQANRIDQEGALLATLVLFDALFVRWALTLTGVSLGVFMLVPAYAAVTLLPLGRPEAPSVRVAANKARRRAA
jgi:hypothetical protein